MGIKSKFDFLAKNIFLCILHEGMIFKFLYDFILVAELFGDFYAACEGIPLHGNGKVVPKRYLFMVGIGEIEHVHVGEGFALTTVVVFYYAIKILAP